MPDWNTAQNILCIRLDTIGDVIMTAPALAALKASRPERRLTLMTSAAGATVAPLIPAVADWIIYDAPWLKATEQRLNNAPELAMVDQLRQANFDAAVIFTVYSQNPLPAAFLCYLAGIPLRLAHCRENPYQLLTDWIKEPEPERFIRHEVQRQLDLVASTGCSTTHSEINSSTYFNANSYSNLYSHSCSNSNLNPNSSSTTGALDALNLSAPNPPLLHLCPVALQRVQQHLAEWGIEGDRWVVIHPGATAASRRYPAEGFAGVARRLVEDTGIHVVFTGTQPEAELVQSIQRQMVVPSHSLVGCLDLRELIALLKLAPLLISNNTAPVHIASAVGTPVVDLYALTNIQHTPWGVPHRVLFHDVPCRLCYRSVCPEGHHHCLRLVDPEAVVQAALELLTQTTPADAALKPVCLT